MFEVWEGKKGAMKLIHVGKALNHRDRKNPRSADVFRELRRKTNALRGKQVYNVETKEYSRG